MLKTTLFSLLLFSFVSLSQQVKAQTDSKKASEKPQNFSSENNLYFGLGLGLDYGGLGTRIEIMPLPFIGFFGAVGYNLQSLAFNGGFSLKILEDEPFTPTIQGMYGYNAVSLPGYSYSGKTYYGPSVGIGVDGKFGKYAHKLFAAVNYPFRSSEFKSDFQNNDDILPITFSIGFNFHISAK